MQSITVEQKQMPYILKILFIIAGSLVSIFLFFFFFILFPLFYLTTFSSLLFSASRMSVVFLIEKFQAKREEKRTSQLESSTIQKAKARESLKNQIITDHSPDTQK